MNRCEDNFKLSNSVDAYTIVVVNVPKTGKVLIILASDFSQEHRCLLSPPFFDYYELLDVWNQLAEAPTLRHLIQTGN